MRQIILSDRYRVNEIILEEKEIWIKQILIMLGMTQEDLIDDSSEQLIKYNIEVWNHLHNGDTEILQDNVLVGKWYTPNLIPKYDENNRIYYEIHLDYNSIIDNEFHTAGDDNG